MASVYQTKSLDSFSSNNSLLKIKLALLTFYNFKYCNWVGRIVIIFEYLQLISQAILTYPLDLLEKESDNHFLVKAVYWLSKLINPSYLLPYGQSDSITSTTLYFIFCLMMLKYILFIYLACITYWSLKEFSGLVTIWKIIFLIQGRVICFMTASFWIRAIIGVSDGNFSIYGLNNILLVVVSGILIGLEYFFSFFLETQFCYMLPTKKFLSSKDFQLQIVSLLQKFICQGLKLIFKTDSLASSWVFDSLNLVFTFIRDYHFYTILPLYNLRALLFQGDLLAIITSLHLSSFFRILLKTVNYSRPTDINFIIAVWIIIAILLIKLSRELIKEVVRNLLTGRTHGAPELLLHKVNATKQLRRHGKQPGTFSEKYALTYLYKATEEANIKQVFGVKSDIFDSSIADINDKDQMNKTFLEYLEGLSVKFPENPLIKLQISKLCIKDWELYTKVIKIISELSKSKWSANYLTSSILLYEIEKSILTKHESQNLSLDLLTYMKCQNFVDEIRKQMIDQIELRITIYNNIIGETSDIGEILKCSQLIAKSKVTIQKCMSILNTTIPDYYIEPLLFCAEYALILDYSLEDYKKYSDIYAKKYFKYEKYYKDVDLTKENLYQDTNVFLLLSGQKLDSGRILFCTKTIENLCGGDKKQYEGSHISRIFPPSIQIFYNELFKQIFETTKKSALNKILRTFLYHKDNYIIEAGFYIRVHPYITQNLYLNMIIRPVPSSNEYILLKENGDIEGATRKIAYRLGISTTLKSNKSNSPSSINIKNISSELYIVNHAFNVIYKKRQLENSTKTNEQRDKFEKKFQSFDDDPVIQMDYRKASDLYDHYSSEEQKIELIPITSSNKYFTFEQAPKLSYHYWCSMSILPMEPAFIKLITLEEAFDDENDANDIPESLKEIEEKSQEQSKSEEIERKENKDFGSLLIGSENIDCCELEKGIETVYYRSYSKRENKHLNTEDGLLSPKSPKSQLITSSPSPKLKKPIVLNQIVTPRSTPNSDLNQRDPGKMQKQENNTVKKRIKLHRYLSSSYSSQNSQGIIVHKSFIKALNTKFYPASFKILCLMFYAMILITLSIQIILKIVTDNTMNDLALKKDMLKYSLLRSQRAIRMQIIARGGELIIEGALEVNNLGGIGSDIKDDIKILEVYRFDLAEQNQNIINNIDSIDDEIREKLFSKDVRIYGSNVESTDLTEKYVTHFQVVDELISSVRRAAGLSEPVSIEGYHALNFMVLNTLNDFAFKNNEISELFLESVKKQKEYFQEIIFLCIIIIPFLLISMALILTFIIWRHYFKEKQNFLALIKLDPAGIRNNLNILKNFKRSLNKEEYFDNINLEEFLSYLTSLPKDTQVSNPHKKQKTQFIKYSKTLSRYYIHTIKVILSMMILTGIIVWNYASAESSTQVIYRRQSQLEFANLISSRVIIEYASFAELFSSNNTNLVEHLDPLTVLKDSILQMKTIQSVTAVKFLEEDSTYNPEIKAILFNNDGCQKFTYLDLKYCYHLVSKGFPLSLLSLMGSLDIQMNTKLQNYLDVDKSSKSKIMAAAYIGIAEVIATFALIATKAQFIAQVIDNNMTKQISDAQFQRSLILLIFSFSLAIVGVLIWSQILVKLREVNNDFKKTLQIFPPKIVLENFLLKTFIKKSSTDYIHDF